MTKRKDRRAATSTAKPQDFDANFPSPRQSKNTEPLTAKTETQKRYINAIKSFPLTFGIGPAGTGKTYIAGALAAQMIENKSIETIIVTRPAVEAGESLGFLPGELDQKYEPFIAPFRMVLEERLGKGMVEYMIKSGRLQALPIAYMRGRTFKDAFVILDEAQNTTPRQMKLFLSRIGSNCKTVVDGDPNQVDLSGPSGLTDATRRLKHIPSIKVITFTRDDIVRSGLVAEIVQAYEEPIPALDLGAY